MVKLSSRQCAALRVPGAADATGNAGADTSTEDRADGCADVCAHNCDGKVCALALHDNASARPARMRLATIAIPIANPIVSSQSRIKPRNPRTALSADGSFTYPPAVVDPRTPFGHQ